MRRLFKREVPVGDAHRQEQIFLDNEPRTIWVQLNHLSVFDNRHGDAPAQISGPHYFGRLCSGQVGGHHPTIQLVFCDLPYNLRVLVDKTARAKRAFIPTPRNLLRHHRRLNAQLLQLHLRNGRG